MASFLEIKVDHIDNDSIKVIDGVGNEVTYDVLGDLRVDDYNANTELKFQHSKYRRYADIFTRITYYLEEAEVELSAIGSRINLDVRNKYLNATKKQPTQDIVNSEIQSREEYIEQQKKVNQLKYQKQQLQYILKAFEQRKDMLVQYTAHLRKDVEHGTMDWKTKM